MSDKSTNNKNGQRSRGPQANRKSPAHSKTAQAPKKHNVNQAPKKPVTNRSPKKSDAKAADGIRLNKYIANSGICSRREADTYIQAGLVHVNDEPVIEMGFRVSLTDKVTFDGSLVAPEPPTYVLLNKPKGFVTTTSENKKDTVMDLVSNATTARVTPIGRLGRNATGLILLTNDDSLKEKLSRNGLNRLFHLELDKNLKYEDLLAIKEGINIKGDVIHIEEVSYVENRPKKEIGIRMKHMGTSVLRKLFDHLGYNLLVVDCVMIGHLTKKDLPRGKWKILAKEEVNPFHMY